jgi:glucose/arabinose dehydrogenase
MNNRKVFFKLKTKIPMKRPSFFILILAIWFLSLPILRVHGSENMGSLELITDKLDFPSNIVSLKDESKRIFVLEKVAGIIRVIKNGKLLPEPFLDIGDRILEEPEIEHGLLGLAFPPGFPSKKHIYVTYTNKNNHLVLSRFKVSLDSNKALKNSEEEVLAIKSWESHFCGHIAFGPRNKFLFLCMGDGDSFWNPRNSTQRLDGLQGKILRLDVESEQKPYGIPEDNPFVSLEGARPEIWVYGLRNPWAFSFDRLTGDLYIPDVGWKYFEEINFQPASSHGGEYYGWDLAEGNFCEKICKDKDITWPIYDYSHGHDGCAVIGGEVYRGKKFSEWNGIYVFGDYCTGKIWGIRDVNGNREIRLIWEEPINITAIASDPDGELLVADAGEGRVFQLNFPKVFDGDWKNINEVQNEGMLDFMRTNTFVNESTEELRGIKSSKRWQWTEPIADFVSWIQRAFN